MSYAVFRPSELDWVSRAEVDRSVARLSDAMTLMRANVWRFGPGTKGVRHSERVQEELFVVLAGRPSMYLGEESERTDLEPGALVVVAPGTPLQVANRGDEDAVVLIVGAPPEAGQADYLDDAPGL